MKILQTFYVPENKQVVLIALLLFISGLLIFISSTWIVLLCIVAFGITLLVLSNPFQGFLLMVALIPLEGISEISSSIGVSEVVGVLTFISYCIYISTYKVKIKTDKGLKLFLMLIGWALLSLIWAYDITIAFYKLITLIELVGFYFLIINIVDSEKKFISILYAFTIGCIICGIITFYYFLSEGVSSFNYRLVLNDQNPNIIGVLMAQSIIIVWYFINDSLRKLKERVIMYIVLVFLLLIMLFSQSRGAWVSLPLAMAFYFLVEKKFNINMIAKIFILFISVFIVFILINSFSQDWLEALYIRGESIFNTSEIGQSRLEIWKVGLTMFRENPFFGVGLNNFNIAYDKYIAVTYNLHMMLEPGRDPHNDYLALICNLGLIGFAIWAVVIFTFFKLSFRTGKYKSLLIPLFFLLLLISTKGSYLWTKYYWLDLGIISAANFLNQRKVVNIWVPNND